MLDLLQALFERLKRGIPVCYTALVETRGSTPQKAGAVMLVFPDGTQAGTLGGGCVEAEVKRRALECLPTAGWALMTFHLDRDYGWDDGLICGGRMTMLVDPLRTEQDADYYRHMHQILQGRRGCTEIVLLEDNPLQREAGDRFLLDAEGRLIAARAKSDILPPALISALKPFAERPRPYVFHGASFLPHLPLSPLVIIGAGHVGQQVAEWASRLDFEVTVIDDRHEYCHPSRFPEGTQCVVGPFDEILPNYPLDLQTFCLIVTRGHQHDEEALFHLVNKPCRYLGLIGSKRKIKLIFSDLLQRGISPEALQRVYAPLGLEIGSQTVPEIALSILAEMVALRNLGELPPGYRRQSLLSPIVSRSPSLVDSHP
ncbi:MAG: hypothetical protein KatS3mg113_1023 [Planctomycetaceae bacterium]|nr:MAG: hypothetical protein KatS3mg113_1023 [Planctomycetaceae bacterium]